MPIAASKSTWAAPRLVAEEALEAGVERLVHTSSAAAIGPAQRGRRTDEKQQFTAGRLGIAYVNSKHEAESELLRVAAQGLDAVIVNPTLALGPSLGSTTSLSIELIRRFLQRRIPAYVDGGLNIVDVRDVAAGHLLADESGATGERYILGGRNFTMQRLFADLSRISGVPAPPLRLPAQLAVGGAKVSELLGLRLGLSVGETRSALSWWTYSSAKAKRELGFVARPHEETLEAAAGVDGGSARRPGRGRSGTSRRRPRAGGPGEQGGGQGPAAMNGSPVPEPGPTSSSTVVRLRPTISARAAESRGACAGSGSSSGPSGCRIAAAIALRSSS